ncbi:MAG TPA: 16S rRNA (cytosine(1402)-N(4))-methyltransferase RsmH [Patescibacteria group bacterium]|nr:16S rRNA (cytosine(1402)-N(4))-methyltransferase RsmH [Patescibacteria group bacterium]
MEFVHIPVLLNQTIENLNIKPGGVYVDCTLGGAGHSSEIAKRIQPGGTLIGIDQDQNAINAAKQKLEPYKDSIIYVKDNFRNIKNAIINAGFEKVDGILMDIGVSSHQLDEEERGFSYMHDGPLDMRMDITRPVTAESILNSADFIEIKRIIRDYGEEKWADRIAKFICQEREKYRISSTFQLVDIIKMAIPAAARREGGHPAKRTFQALRIAVNEELDVLETALYDAIEMLSTGGRLVVITFHSLEDRIVKNIFNQMERPCTCPTEIPVCVCGKTPQLKVLTRKPVTAEEGELAHNSRAKSAKLRAAERVGSKNI